MCVGRGEDVILQLLGNRVDYKNDALANLLDCVTPHVITS